MSIKEKRLSAKMSQDELAKILGVSTRTIRRYENGEINKIKYQYVLKTLEDHNRVDEEHGILSLTDIVNGINKASTNYKIEFVYLFGSYAKEEAKPESDVDLLIKTSEIGLRYFGLVEELRTNLKKKIDVININDIIDNKELLLDILNDGVKIYG